MSRKRLIVGFGAVLLSAAAAHASVLTMGPFADNTGPVLLETDFTDTFLIPRFDPRRGSLLQVDVTLAGAVQGDVQFENKSSTAAIITTNLKATLTLTDPLNNTLATVIPIVTNVDHVSGKDSAVDFGGTAGRSYFGLSNSKSVSASYTLNAIISQFIGLGNISLGLDAAGSSTATGSGNLVTSFTSNAGANVLVTYTYDDSTAAAPEPGTMMLLGSALISLGVIGRKRFARR